MKAPARTDFVRLALIEGAVIALGGLLVGLLGAVVCSFDPQIVAATLLPTPH
jgi:hypothetical protein